MLTTIVVAGSIATALTAVFAFRFRAWKAPRRLVAYFSIFFVIELVAERLTRRPAENVRVATDELGEGPTVERGGGGRMGAQPIFGDRAAAWLLAEDGRDGIRGAPGVVHDRAMELLHEDPSSGDGGMVGVRRASILPS